MIKLLKTLCCLGLFALQANAQLTVPDARIRPLINSATVFSIEDIKDAVTYFVVPDSFAQAEYDKLEKEITSIWTLGKIRFMWAAEADKKAFIAGKAAFIRIEGVIYYDQLNRSSDYASYLLFSFQRKGAYYSTTLFRIKLYPSTPALLKLARRYSEIRTTHLETVCNNNASIANWSVGNIKNCIIYAQPIILAGERYQKNRFITENKNQIAKLKEKGLSFPSYILNNNTVFKKGQLVEEGKIFDDFEIPYVLKENDAISNDILTATEDYYYVSVVSYRQRTFYTIWNGKSSELILDISFEGNTVKKGHLSRIAKLLK